MVFLVPPPPPIIGFFDQDSQFKKLGILVVLQTYTVPHLVYCVCCNLCNLFDCTHIIKILVGTHDLQTL